MAEALRHSVVLLYPTGGTNEDCFTTSLVSIISYDGQNHGYLCDAMGINGLYVDSNRDLGCRRFMRYRLCSVCRNVINQGNILPDRSALHCNFCDIDVPEPLVPDWLWWLDTDIGFQDYRVLDQLLASADPVERPVVSALYFGRMNGPEITPVWYGRNEKDGSFDTLTSFHSGLNHVGVVGMGCCLIHRSVFEKFGDKYAKTGWLYFGRDTSPWHPTPGWNNDIMPFGEDNCFAYRCRELGIPIYGNADIQVNHLKKQYLNFNTFMESFAHKKTDEKGTATWMRRKPRQKIMGSRARTLGGLDDSGYQPGDEAGHNSGLGEAAVHMERWQCVR